MAQIGSERAVVDLRNVGSEDLPAGVTKTDDFNPKGKAAFAIWRGAYWQMTISNTNKLLIPMYWFKAYFFGRDISRF